MLACIWQDAFLLFARWSHSNDEIWLFLKLLALYKEKWRKLLVVPTCLRNLFAWVSSRWTLVARRMYKAIGRTWQGELHLDCCMLAWRLNTQVSKERMANKRRPKANKEVFSLVGIVVEAPSSERLALLRRQQTICESASYRFESLQVASLREVMQFDFWVAVD